MLLGVRRHAAQRAGPQLVDRAGPAPGLARRGFVARHRGDRPVGRAQIGERCAAVPQRLRMLPGGDALGRQRRRHIGELVCEVVRAGLEQCRGLDLPRVGDQRPLERADLRQLLPVDPLRKRIAGLFDRQPHHRNQIRQDQHQVLRHLGPGDRPHAAQERTQQHAAQAEKDAEHEIDAGELDGDEAHAVDLRHQVDERAQDGRGQPDAARKRAAVPVAQEIGNRVGAELAQIRRQQQRHQTVPAGPADDIRQPAVALQVQGAGQADERRGRHPVGGGRHAVVERRDAPPGNVVLERVGGSANDADVASRNSTPIQRRLRPRCSSRPTKSTNQAKAATPVR